MLAKIVQDRRDLALLLIRIAFGVIFFFYGWRHITGLEGYTDAYANRFHIPFPSFFAPLVASLEIVGGAAALLGIFTRYVGLLLAIVMVVSTLTGKLPAGLAQGRDLLGITGFWDIDFSLFTMGVALLLMGPGKFAVEQLIFKREL
ncbi:DoxX family protein [Candidatus Acetothermia bacterium]|nr:DoxX family protein [Candidatus Acetothermia bacterium]